MVERKRFKLNWKIALIAAVVAIVMIIVIVVAIAVNRREDYDANYFVSDGTKLVVAMDSGIAAYENDIYEPDITYVVYYYSGDTINNMKVFFAYDDETEAERAFNNITLEGKNWAKDKSLSGRFVIFEAVENEYSEVSTTYIKKLIEDMKSAGTFYEPDDEIKEEIYDADDDLGDD